MVSQAELILRVITLWFLVLSHFFLESAWVPLITNAHLKQKNKNVIYESICETLERFSHLGKDSVSYVWNRLE